MELDRLRQDEIIQVAAIFNLLGITDDIEDIGRRIRILEGALDKYRSDLAELQRNGGDRA